MNPMFAADIIKNAQAMQLQQAQIDKDRLANIQVIGDRRAGEFQAILNASKGNPDQGIPADRTLAKNLWNNAMLEHYQSGEINKQQYTQAIAGDVPDAVHLAAFRDLNLTASQSAANSQKIQESQYFGARAASLNATAQMENAKVHAIAALANAPTNATDIPGWLAQQPADIQKALTGPDGTPVKSVQALQASLRVLANPTDIQKQAQQSDIAAWQGARNAAAGGVAAWNDYMGALRVTDPEKYRAISAVAPQDKYDAATYPKLLNQAALAPEQYSQAQNQSANRDQRAAADEQRANQQAFMNSLREQNLALREQAFSQRNNGLTPNQVRQQWNTYTNQEQAIQTQLINRGQELAAGKFLGGKQSGTDLTQADVNAKRALMEQDKSQLQQIQMGKARLMGLDTIDPSALAEGQTMPSSNPALQWKKVNGIVYPMSVPGGTSPTQGAQAPAPNTQNRPAANQPPATPPARTNPGNLEPGTQHSGRQHAMGQQWQNPQAPPNSFLARVPEGKRFQGPDGTVWKKVNGKAVQQSGQ
jgi:hypothetical protein